MEVLDQKARDAATDAKSQIIAHEQLCQERWQSAYKTMEKLGNRVSWMIAILIAGQGGLTAILLAFVLQRMS